MTVFSGISVPKVDVPIILTLILMIVPQLLFHGATIRWSSLLYSCMFGFYFMLGIRAYIRSHITDRELMIIFKKIIFAYCIVLIIQQLCRLIGLPVFNGIILPEDNPWKLHSLAPEPSHTALYLGILMTAFCCMSDLVVKQEQSFPESLRRNKSTWLVFFYTMITMMSGSAILVIFIVLARYISKKNLIIFSSLIVMFLALGKVSDLAGISRSSTFMNAVLTGDYQAMAKADHSASVRVVPALLCLTHINPFSLSGLIGDGMGAVATWMSHYFGGVESNFSGGGAFSYIVEFGLLPGITLFSSSLRWTIIKRIILTSIGLWIMCNVFGATINTQVFWSYIMIMYITKDRYRHLRQNKLSPVLIENPS